MTTNPLPDIETALEECRARLETGEPLEECLAGFPREYHDELRRLLALTPRLRSLQHDPSPAFRARLERRLLDRVDAERAARRPSPWWSPARWLGGAGVAGGARSLRMLPVALVLALLLVSSGVGATHAATDSLPDSPLYTVKSAREWTERLFAWDESSRETVRARQASERARELDLALQRRKGQAVVNELAKRVVNSTERFVGYALEQAAAGNPRPALRVQMQLRELNSRVRALSEQAPRDLRPAFERLSTYLEGQMQRLRTAARERGGVFAPARAAGRDGGWIG